jgi:prolyl oligopeptidase
MMTECKFSKTLKRARVPLHSYKLIATLQHELPNNDLPLMIRIQTKAGHGAGKSTQQWINETVDVLSFVANVLPE